MYIIMFSLFIYRKLSQGFLQMWILSVKREKRYSFKIPPLYCPNSLTFYQTGFNSPHSSLWVLSPLYFNDVMLYALPSISLSTHFKMAYLIGELYFCKTVHLSSALFAQLAHNVKGHKRYCTIYPLHTVFCIDCILTAYCLCMSIEWSHILLYSKHVKI